MRMVSWDAAARYYTGGETRCWKVRDRSNRQNAQSSLDWRDTSDLVMHSCVCVCVCVWSIVMEKKYTYYY